MSTQNIELIAVGDEILIGHTLDSNSNWIAGKLSEHGLRLRWQSTVGDNSSDLRHQVRRAWERADVVILSGGLGPTHDDITRPVIAKFFNDKLVTRAELIQGIKDRFAERGLVPSPGYEIMGEFPSQAEPILNKHGSAPGIHYQKAGKNLFSLPGVPVEMQGMIESYVLPLLLKNRVDTYRHQIFRTSGMGESHLSQLIGNPADLGQVSLAYLPSIDHGVTIRLTAAESDETALEKVLHSAADKVRERIGRYIFTEDYRTLEEIILDKLRHKKQRLAVAESCTGGMICDRLVSVPGSSDVLERGYITYSNRAKSELLGIDPTIIETRGAVSSETAAAMAIGARQQADVDYGLSVTGIAGPTGGTEDKPVGLVFIGLCTPVRTIIEQFTFSGDRTNNRRRSAHAALNLLWKNLT